MILLIILSSILLGPIQTILKAIHENPEKSMEVIDTECEEMDIELSPEIKEKLASVI